MTQLEEARRLARRPMVAQVKEAMKGVLVSHALTPSEVILLARTRPCQEGTFLYHHASDVARVVGEIVRKSGKPVQF